MGWHIGFFVNISRNVLIWCTSLLPHDTSSDTQTLIFNCIVARLQVCWQFFLQKKTKFDETDIKRLIENIGILIEFRLVALFSWKNLKTISGLLYFTDNCCKHRIFLRRQIFFQWQTLGGDSRKSTKNLDKVSEFATEQKSDFTMICYVDNRCRWNNNW